MTLYKHDKKTEKNCIIRKLLMIWISVCTVNRNANISWDNLYCVNTGSFFLLVYFMLPRSQLWDEVVSDSLQPWICAAQIPCSSHHPWLCGCRTPPWRAPCPASPSIHPESSPWGLRPSLPQPHSPFNTAHTEMRLLASPGSYVFWSLCLKHLPPSSSAKVAQAQGTFS